MNVSRGHKLVESMYGAYHKGAMMIGYSSIGKERMMPKKKKGDSDRRKRPRGRPDLLST